MSSLPDKSDLNVGHAVTFDLPEVYLYQCTPHGNMGMLGIIVVDINFDNLEKIEALELSQLAKSVPQRLVRIVKSNE